MTGFAQECELCEQPGGLLVHQDREWRVVRVADANFPAFYRLIWQAHVAEFSQLDTLHRQRCMEAVCTVEGVLRQSLAPTKINLASLGNAVPHLHWHVIARFDWDSHFPQPIWGQAQRQVADAAVRLGLPLPELDERVRRALAALPGPLH